MKKLNDKELVKAIFDKMYEKWGYTQERIFEEFKDDTEWFGRFEWSEREQDEFKIWAIDFIKKNAKRGMIKSRAEKEIVWFLLAYAPCFPNAKRYEHLEKIKRL